MSESCARNQVMRMQERLLFRMRLLGAGAMVAYNAGCRLQRPDGRRQGDTLPVLLWVESEAAFLTLELCLLLNLIRLQLRVHDHNSQSIHGAVDYHPRPD